MDIGKIINVKRTQQVYNNFAFYFEFDTILNIVIGKRLRHDVLNTISYSFVRTLGTYNDATVRKRLITTYNLYVCTSLNNHVDYDIDKCAYQYYNTDVRFFGSRLFLESYKSTLLSYTYLRLYRVDFIKQTELILSILILLIINFNNLKLLIINKLL